MNCEEHIIADPNILFGKPVIKGTRTPVYIIFEKLALGYTHEDLYQAYPRLTNEHIQACMLYAADNTRFVLNPGG